MFNTYCKATLLFLFTVALVGCGSREADEAKKLGFVNVDEMKALHAKGWHTKQQYEKDLVVLEKKIAEERIAAEAKIAEEKRAAAEKCKSDPSECLAQTKKQIVAKLDQLAWKVPIEFACSSIQTFPNGQSADLGRGAGYDGSKAELQTRRLTAHGMSAQGWNQPPHSFRRCTSVHKTIKIGGFGYDKAIEAILFDIDGSDGLYSATNIKDLMELR